MIGIRRGYVTPEIAGKFPGRSTNMLVQWEGMDAQWE
jgi:hypothetical protein